MNRNQLQQSSDSLVEQTCRRPSRRRRVTFEPSVNVRQSRTIRSAEDKSRMHYSKMELLSMVQDARAVASSSKKLAAHSRLAVDPTEASSGNLVRLGEDESMRGLEFTHPTRQTRKQLARKAVLKYQRLISNRHTSAPSHEKSDMLASASAKLSEWSRLVSIETARIDSLDVFSAEYLIPVDLEPVEITSFPLLKFKTTEGSSKTKERSKSFSAYKKRRVTADEDDQPLKKIIRRMSASVA